MSKELAKRIGLEIGQKVLYPHQIGSNYGAPVYMDIVTIKDVHILSYSQEVVIDIEEFEGYIDYRRVYSQYQINNMFDSYELIEKEKDEKKDVVHIGGSSIQILKSIYCSHCGFKLDSQGICQNINCDCYQMKPFKKRTKEEDKIVKELKHKSEREGVKREPLTEAEKNYLKNRRNLRHFC